MNWLYVRLSECRRLSKQISPNIPCVAFTAGDDDLVHNPSIDQRMNNWPNVKHVVIENGKHDLLGELPEVRAGVIAQICKLYDSAGAAKVAALPDPDDRQGELV